MDLFNLLVTLAELLYCLVLIFLAAIVLLWMVGRAKEKSNHKRTYRPPYEAFVGGIGSRLAENAVTSYRGTYSPSGLTPTIDVPPRRLSFSATTPGPTFGKVRSRPISHIPRRVTFSLTPSQESNERRNQSRGCHRAPYRSPGPEVVVHDEQIASLAENSPLIELFPGGRTESGASDSFIRSVHSYGRRRTATNYRDTGTFSRYGAESLGPGVRGVYTAREPRQILRKNEKQARHRPSQALNGKHSHTSVNHRDDLPASHVRSDHGDAANDDARRSSGPPSKKTMSPPVSGYLTAANVSDGEPRNSVFDRKENIISNAASSNTAPVDSLAAVTKSWIPLDAQQKSRTFRFLSRFERQALSLESHHNGGENIHLALHGKAVKPPSDSNRDILAGHASWKADSPPSSVRQVDPPSQAPSHVKKVRFSLEGETSNPYHPLVQSGAR